MRWRVQTAWISLALGLGLAGCASADGAATAPTIGEAMVGANSGSLHAAGVVARVTSPMCPRVTVSGATIPGVSSTKFVADNPDFASDWSLAFGTAWPNAMRSLPLYCVYPSDDLTAVNAQAELEAAVKALLGPTAAVSTLKTTSTTRPTGHQCTPCQVPTVPEY